MLNMPVDTIVAKIREETGLSADEITKQIKAKIKELQGLVSEEGAAFIVASELGVHLLRESSLGKPVDIKNLVSGMKNIDISGKVKAAYPVKSFVKGTETREVASLIIEDSTGDTRVVFWDDKPALVREGRVSRGSLVKIKNAQVKKGLKGDNEVHVGSRSSVIVTSQEDGGKEDYANKICAVAELQDNVRASVIAEVVGLFEPKLYPTCPVCNKKVIPAVEGFLCAEHKKVTPGESMLLSFHLDDGTAVIRTVAFGKNAEKLCGLTITEIKSLGTEATESINAFLLGRTIRATGMARDNKNYARLEFAVNDVDVAPDPKNLAMKMMEA